MRVELIIFFYLLVCLFMICFNLSCILFFHLQEKHLSRHSTHFEQAITQQIQNFPVTEKHKRYLTRKLVHLRFLMAYDDTLERMQKIDPIGTAAYLEQVSSVFVFLTQRYSSKDQLQSAYYPYILKKYALFRSVPSTVVSHTLLQLVHSPNLYCRENALQALYSMGNERNILRAMYILNNNPAYHNRKIIADGLLQFNGNHKKLSLLLWGALNEFQLDYKLAFLDYFRFQSGEWQPQFLSLMKEPHQNLEIVISCTRYLGKYPYPPAYPALLALAAQQDDGTYWESISIACTALASYPGPKTIHLLEEKLHSRNWFIRINASESLEHLGLNYLDLVDILEGGDRYAAEILRYRLEQKKLHEVDQHPTKEMSLV